MLLSTAAGNCSPACAPCGRIPGRWGFWPGPKSPSGDEYFVHIARVRGAAGNLRTRLLCSSYVQISSQTAGNEKEQGALTSSVHWYHERALSVRLESRGRRDIERTLLAGLGCLAHRLESRGCRDVERTPLAGIGCLAHRLESRGCRDVERTPLAGLGLRIVSPPSYPWWREVTVHWLGQYPRANPHTSPLKRVWQDCKGCHCWPLATNGAMRVSCHGYIVLFGTPLKVLLGSMMLRTWTLQIYMKGTIINEKRRAKQCSCPPPCYGVTHGQLYTLCYAKFRAENF